MRNKTIATCLNCFKLFQVYPYMLKKGHGKYCSIKCSSVSNPTKIKKGQRLSPNTEFKKGNQPQNWKGEDVGIKCLHDWVKRNLGKPNCCEKCGSKDKKKYEWANKSHEYLRDLSDWIRLCTSCHRKYDLTPEKKRQAIKNLSWNKEGVRIYA